MVAFIKSKRHITLSERRERKIKRPGENEGKWERAQHQQHQQQQIYIEKSRAYFFLSISPLNFSQHAMLCCADVVVVVIFYFRFIIRSFMFTFGRQRRATNEKSKTKTNSLNFNFKY